MGKGSYPGGHTVIGPNSEGWFSGRSKTDPIAERMERFLKKVIDCELRSVPEPPIPKQLRPYITKGGAMKWARTQKDYQNIKLWGEARMKEKKRWAY